MPKHLRWEDYESDEEVPPPKKNCFELPNNLQNEVIVGLIVSGTTPDRDLLQNIKIEFLIIKNLWHLVLPHWLCDIPSLKEIVIENCKEFKQDIAEVNEDDLFYDFELHALTSITFRRCKKIYINSFSRWAPNLQTVKFDVCECVDIVGESRESGIENILLNCSKFGNLDWIGSSPKTKRLYMNYSPSSEIPSQIRNMSRLEDVYLSLDVKKIPKISTMWPNVRVLNLSLTLTTHFQEGAFEELQHLESLTIRGSVKVGSLQQIASIPNLKNLFLHNVNFNNTDVPDENTFQKLDSLHIQEDWMPFPNWIHRCKNIISLCLSGSIHRPQALPENLACLDKLEDIQLINILPNSYILPLLKMPSLKSISIDSYSWKK